MASNEVWGIDIGKSSLKAVKMRRSKGQLEIVGIEIVEYEAPGNGEEVDREEQIRQALTEFQTRNKIKKEKIFVSIPGQATFNRLITIPPVEQKRVEEIVTYEAQQQIPFPIEEVIWDYQVIGDEEKAAEEREVMLFAVRKEIINNFLNNLENAGLQVAGIQIAPLAIYNFVKYENPDVKASVAIDIGAENTDLVVIDGDKLWLRALPSAGDDITKALQKRFNVPYQEAEKLKIKSGKTKQSKKIFEVMKPVLKDLVGEIHRSVGYYKSMAKDIKFEKMIFMGNATKLTGFEKFFSQNLQYEISVLSQLSRIRVSPKISVNLFQTNIATFSVAMGLAIQGLGESVNQVRLLPKEKLSKLYTESQKPFLIAAVVILGIVPIYQYASALQIKEQLTEINKSVQPLENRIEKAQKKLNEVKNYQGLQDQLSTYVSLGESRGMWPNILNHMNDTYHQASQEIQKQRENKIWIRGYNLKKQDDQLRVLWKLSFEGLKEGEVKDPVEDLAYLNKHIIFPLRNVMEEKELFELPKDYQKALEEQDISQGFRDEFKNNYKELGEDLAIEPAGEKWQLLDKSQQKRYFIIPQEEGLSVFRSFYDVVKVSDTDASVYGTSPFTKEIQFGEPKIYFLTTVEMRVPLKK